MLAFSDCLVTSVGSTLGYSRDEDMLMTQYHVAVVADVVSAELQRVFSQSQECYTMEYPPTSPHINAFFRKYSIVLFVVLCQCSTCSNRLVPNSRKLHYILDKKPKWF